MFFFFKQKTAYEMRISDWSSDVCSSDLSCIIIGDVRRKAQVARRTQVQADLDPVDVGAAAVDRIGVEVDRREQARLNIAPVDVIGGDVDAQRLVDQVEARPDLEVFRRIAFKGQRQAGDGGRIDVDASDTETLRIDTINHKIKIRKRSWRE